MPDTHKADVVIVGSGVAGALVAWKLAAAGAKVLVLEAGSRVDRAKAVETFRLNPDKGPDSPYPDQDYAPRPKVMDLDAYYVQQGPDKFYGVYERQVGGTTWHWLGTALRFLPEDFAMKSRYGVGVDWPVSYQDLEPWYCEAEKAMGVSGDSKAPLGSPRSQSYPNGPIHPSWLDQVVAKAVKGMGRTVHGLPQARNSANYEGRPACCGNASCVPICPIGAKYDASHHVTLAEDKGAVVLDQAVAFSLEVDPAGAVSGVLFKRPDGTQERAEGRLYVVACHAIETPKLLLISRSDRLPDGVANSSGQVGRNLMGNPVQSSFALTAEPVWPFRSALTTSALLEERSGPARAKRAAFWTALGNSGWGGGPISLAPKLIEQGLRGAKLQGALRDQLSRQIKLASPCEQLPDPENRVTADFAKVDALGIPRPAIRYSLGDYSRKALAEARAVHEKVFDALKATERRYDEHAMDPAHIMGTCRMGEDPKTSVVDRDLRSHDHKNLFLVGSAVYPTVGTATPTLTIATLALRAAATLEKELKKA